MPYVLAGLFWLLLATGLGLADNLPLMGVGGGAACLAYSGPGDQVASAAAWYGTRGYSSARVSGGTQKSVNIIRASDSTTKDILITCSGGFDTATANTFCNATTCKVVTWYDQTGNGHDVTQATDGARPALTFSDLNSIPCLHFSGRVATLQGSIGSTSRPVSFAAVVNFDDTASSNPVITIATSANSDPDFIQSTINTISIWETAELRTGTFTDTTWGAASAVANGASSAIEINGTRTTGNTSTAGAASTSIALGAHTDGNQKAAEHICEAGMWASAISSTDQGNLNTNMRNYWNF